MNFRYVLAFVFLLSACGSDDTVEPTTCSQDADCPPNFLCDDAGLCQSRDLFQGDVTDGNTNDSSSNGNDNNVNANDNGNTNSGGTGGEGDTPTDDGTGPVVSIVSPQPLELALPTARIEVSVVDMAGIPVGSVRATVGRENGQDRIEVQLTAEGVAEGVETVTAGTFVGTFETGRLPPIIFPFITVRAEDVFGNATELGHAFAVDFVSPAVAFYDELIVYESFEDGCSQAFVPTGLDNVRHGMVASPNSSASVLDDALPTTFPIRVRIEDRSNATLIGDPNAAAILAGVDPSRTKVYILDQAAIASGARMFVDSGGGECVIDPSIRPQGTMREPAEAIVLDLTPIPPSGTPWYVDPNVFIDDSIRQPLDPNTLGFSCGAFTSNTPSPPSPVCERRADGVDAWIRSDRTIDEVAGIYTLTPYAPASDSLTCGGGFFDIINTLEDGPMCLAVETADLIGSVAVSRVIAVCVDADGSGDCAGFDATAADAVAASCMSACTPAPAVFSDVIRVP